MKLIVKTINWVVTETCSNIAEITGLLVIENESGGEVWFNFVRGFYELIWFLVGSD